MQAREASLGTDGNVSTAGVKAQNAMNRMSIYTAAALRGMCPEESKSECQRDLHTRVHSCTVHKSSVAMEDELKGCGMGVKEGYRRGRRDTGHITGHQLSVCKHHKEVPYSIQSAQLTALTCSSKWLTDEKQTEER